MQLHFLLTVANVLILAVVRIATLHLFSLLKEFCVEVCNGKDFLTELGDPFMSEDCCLLVLTHFYENVK